MDQTDSTCWTVLRDAAAGAGEAREAFAGRYAPLVRAYLGARWRTSPLLQEIDDATQEVFVECLRQGGGLQKVMPGRPGGFRAFLYGLVRNVALRFEQGRSRRREQQPPESFEADQFEARDDALSQVFDRAWAKAIMREAAEKQAGRAEGQGEAHRRRVELLRLRFHDGLPIREIARLWEADPTHLHREYARAREEFRAALMETLAYHHPDSPAEVERECRELLALLE
jgi:RNA polymerase sigma factor (sigma-70 family)